MIGRGGFVARFLLLFALLAALGWLSRAPHAYATLLRLAGSAACPLVNGWTLEDRSTTFGRQEIYFRKGNDELRLALGLDQLALGLLPLFALLGATPGLGPRRLAGRIALGAAGLFVLDLLVVLIYPWLVGDPNPVTDILGTFLGLLTFVGGPVILWFVLTYEQLRGVWRLDRRHG
ncbi:MAG TPA: hypothetical protein VL049_19300 [Candidatus Dormibacteraeota bacterium]|nr:hypothetical protein [Candidatus Dormibacteraeota bacterium]